jgi:hypothetical protein
VAVDAAGGVATGVGQLLQQARHSGRHIPPPSRNSQAKMADTLR